MNCHTKTAALSCLSLFLIQFIYLPAPASAISENPTSAASQSRASADDGASTDAFWVQESTNNGNQKASPGGLSCTITKTDGGLSAQISSMDEDAIRKSEAAQEIAKLVDKFRTARHKATVTAKEAICTIVPYRGFGPSKEGANVVLEQISKVKSLAAAEYMKQRIEDSIHTKVVESTLEIGMGLDATDPQQRKKMLDTGYNKLKELLGDEQAKSAMDKITSWSKDIDVPVSAYNQPTWDVDNFQGKVRDCMAVSVETDPVMHDVVNKIKKYKRSKKMVALSGAIESALALSCIVAPGMFVPIGVELANGAFVASTGGSEPTKIVNELYYGKSIESRWKRLHEETHMALMNYQTAVRTRSPIVMACSEAILSQLVGADRIPKILGQSVLANGAVQRDVPIQTAEKPLTTPDIK